MKLKYPTSVKVKIITLGLFVIAFLGFAIPASGITFGREVTNASTAYPSVVSIWYSPNSSESPDFICSGTLIEPRVVLTAAHCVLSTGLYYVRYGADQLDEDIPALEVDATWKNPRYSERQGVNDVGLLLLTKPIQGAQVTPLSNKSTLEKVQANKSVKYEIAGWGKDQNSEDATYLRKAAVDDQTAFARKIKAWAPWRNDVWFAVGKYNAKEKVFAGACNGDSGGPLFAYLNGTTYLAGVTSWGAEDCELGAPSVYVRLSYYIDVIKSVGIPQLYVNEVKQNRSKPSFTRLPRIIGQGKAGSTISCDTGAVSLNTQEWTYRWTLNGSNISPTPESITLTPSSSSSIGREYTCIVTAKNSNGTIIESVSVKQPPLPASTTLTTVSGVPTSASSITSTATCTAAKFTNANSVQNEWWISSSSNFALASKISSGNTITLDTNFYINNGGKYLFCVSRASGDGGTSDSISTSVLVPSFEKPVVRTYPRISGITAGVPVAIGSVATCSDWSWQNKIDSEEIAWYGNSTSDLVPATKIGSGKTLVLSQALIEKYGNAYIMCLVTAKNSGGYLGIYTPVLLTPPNSLSKIPLPSYANVSIEGFGISSTVPIGTTATCKLSLTPKDFDVTYTWGISTYAYPAAIKTVIATGQTLVISDVVFSQLGDNSLACQATMSNAGGSRSVVTGVKIYKPVSSNSNATVKPNPVQDFTGNIGEKGTTLSWSPPKSNGAIVTSYVIERTDNYEPGVNGESVWRVVGTTSGTSLFVAELNPCHSSNYRMRAFTGNQYSDYSPTLGANNARRCNTVLGLVSIGSPVSVSKGFTVQINNFDNTNFEWKVLLPVSPQGRYAQVSSTGLISDSEMTPGVSARLYIFKISRSTGEYVGVTTVTVVAGR